MRLTLDGDIENSVYLNDNIEDFYFIKDELARGRLEVCEHVRRCYFKPSQLTPFPVYPDMQAHEKLPLLLVQSALE